MVQVLPVPALASIRLRPPGARSSLRQSTRTVGDATSLMPRPPAPASRTRSEEHTSELQSLMRISYAVFCLKKKTSKTSETYAPLKNQQQQAQNLRSNTQS